MFSLNRIQLIGHLTEKPEVRQLANGTSVVDLNIKTITTVKKEDGNTIILPSYHTVTVWRRMAEIVGDYCKAGSQIYISGRIKTDQWEDENGQKKYKTKVIADDLILLDSRKEMPALPESSAVAGGFNEAEVIGNLTKAPELRQTTSGQNVANFSVATNRRWQDKNTGEQKEETEFHNVVAWGGLATEAAEQFQTGQKAFVRGRLHTRSWDTPDGEKKYTTEIIADEVLQLGAPSSEFAEGGASSAGSVAAPAAAATTAGATTEGGAVPEIPEIKYESDIKPEDLPF